MKFKLDFSSIEDYAKKLSDDEMFKEMLKDIVEQITDDFMDVLLRNTPEKTGRLRQGWLDSVPYHIKKVNGGYTIELNNSCPYANAVNYGHHAYNQFGGPYIVKNRTVEYYQGERGATFVYGVFFLEKSLEEYSGSQTNIRNAIKRELENWWEWVNNG